MNAERHTYNRNTLRSQSTARALSVLNLLENASDGLGVREVARRLKLAPSIVQRLLATLADYGYVERSSNGTSYRIGFRLFQVGRTYLRHNNLHSISLPELRELAERHHVNAYLGVLRGDRVIYLETLQSRGPIAIVSTPGSAAYLHSTAFGKALLAELADVDVERLLGAEPYAALTRKTITRLKSFLKELAEVRRLGYAISDEENIENVYSAGAVIRDANGAPVAAISGAVPRSQMNKGDGEALCRLVQGAADRICQRLGAPPRRPAVRVKTTGKVQA